MKELSNDTDCSEKVLYAENIVNMQYKVNPMKQTEKAIFEKKIHPLSFGSYLSYLKIKH